MRTTKRRKENGYGAIFIMITLALTLAAGNVLAHNVMSSITVKNSLPVGTFHYADGTALSFADVKVWAPDEDQVEFQNGRTDKNGRYSFIPDRDGIWRITAEDGLGHAATVVYEVTGSVEISEPLQKTEIHSLLFTLLGISLIFNLAFVVRLLK